MINHIRVKPGIIYGNPEDSPGGNMLKHNCSVRLQITKRDSAKQKIFIEDDDAGKRVIGAYAGVRIVKNRMSKPLLDEDGKSITMDIPIYYETYFPDIEDVLFDTARRMKIISGRKNVYTWGETKIEGKEAFIQELKTKNLVSKLGTLIKAEAKKENIILPPELVKTKFEEKGVTTTLITMEQPVEEAKRQKRKKELEETTHEGQTA
jgi:recombination protein RecA